MHKTKKNIIFFSILVGLSLGFLFRLLVLIVEIGMTEMSYSFENIVLIHTQHPINYFITFIALFAFSFLGYLAGVFLLKQSKKYEIELSSVKERTLKVSDFIENLRKGNIQIDYKIEDEEDELGVSLIKLRDELNRTKYADQERKNEEDQRQWTSEGLAAFGAILRENGQDLELLSNKVISSLVKYIDAKQAGFFVVNESNPEEITIDEIANFAYGRKKFTDQKLKWGEGLVGACMLEKETIFMDKVPDDYVEITSGLGKSNPRSILIVPLKTEDRIHGALEVASFKVYKKFEIEFVEKVAQSIATTITNLKINMQTSNLLEESRQQAKVLTEQEEKMRRTVEEMRQLQIEAAQQSEQFVSFTNSVNHTMIRAEYSKDGVLTYANTKFLEILNYKSNSEVEGKHITTFINKKDQVWFDELWERLISGGKHFEGDMKHVTRDGKDVWTIATYVSVRDYEGNPEKILFLGIDTTDDKKQSLDYEGQINALNHSSLKAEYTPDGLILDFNNRLLEILGYQLEEVTGKSIFDFINAEEVDDFRTVWKNILTGIPFEGRIKRMNKSGEENWFYGSFSIVKDIYDEIAKIVFIGNDVTLQRVMEIKNKEQTEILKLQEEKLQQAKIDLSKKLKESREEMKLQFREIETVKLLNEKTLEGMLDAIVTINQDNKIEFFNKAAEELWGVERDAVLDKDLAILLPEIEVDDEEEGEYIGKYFKIGENQAINTRKEVFIKDSSDENISVLLTLSEAGIGMRYRLTAFIQRIEVELF